VDRCCKFPDYFNLFVADIDRGKKPSIDQKQENKMKNTILRIIGTSFAILLLTTFAQISASAQGKSDEQCRNSLEGSWNHVTTRLNCQTGAALGTFQAMFTFSEGGTFWEAGTGTAPSLRGPSHGVWSRESLGVYSAAFQFFRFNPDGTWAGRQIVRQHIEVSEDGESYTAGATVQILDVAGNVIANNCARGVGTRFE
jgi:hypothetical protein